MTYPRPYIPKLRMLLVAASGAGLFFGLVRPSPAATAAVSTQPVGIINLQAAAGGTSALSLPLDPAAAYVGVVSSVGRRTLRWAGKGWPARSAASYQATPYAVRVTSGRGAGLAFLILSGGTNDARLDVPTDLTGQISQGDKFEILPADTLESVFGADGGGLATNANPARADNVRLLRNGKWETYYHDGQHWSLEGDASHASRNLVVIPPGQGFLVIRRAPGPWNLQVTGDVPIDPEIRLPRGVTRALIGDPLSSHRLADLELPGPQRGYEVTIYSLSSLRTYSFRKGEWKATGGSGSRIGPRLATGSAVLVERAGGKTP